MKKSRGRPRLQDGEFRKLVTTSMDKNTWEELCLLSQDMGISKSKIVSLLINQAKKDQTLRCLLLNENRYQADKLRANKNASLEWFVISGNYVTFREKNGRCYTMPCSRPWRPSIEKTNEKIKERQQEKELIQLYEKEMEHDEKIGLERISFEEWKGARA